MCKLRACGQIVIDNTIRSEIMRVYTTNQNRGSCLHKREKKEKVSVKGRESCKTREINKSS